MSGKIKSLSGESRFVGDHISFMPGKSGFRMAIGFPDTMLTPDIGEFTFKYREKVRVRDGKTETGWITKTKPSVVVDHYPC